MTNNEIKENCRRDSIVQSAKEILTGEGLKCFSVKNVAEKVDCSYATIHDYFSNANDLLSCCVNELQNECVAYVKEKLSKCEDERERLSVGIFACIEYFTEYPGTFDLLYLEKAGDLGNSKQLLDLINGFIDRVFDQEWLLYKEQKGYTDNKVAVVKQQMKYVIVGLFLFFLNRRSYQFHSDFMGESKRQINAILDQSN